MLRHFAIIPDGNRRWAKRRGLPPREGHVRGFLHLTPRLLESLWERQVHTVTLWLFSTENWRRPAGEVQDLMEIFERLLVLLLPLARRHGVRIRHLGRSDRIPGALVARFAEVVKTTQAFDRHVLNLAVDYGGRDELVESVRRLLAAAPPPEEVDEACLGAALQSAGQPYPEPDLILRTSGEQRLSGFLLFRSTYSELYFTDTLYPDLDDAAIDKALDSFQHRDRRFGR